MPWWAWVLVASYTAFMFLVARPLAGHLAWRFLNASHDAAVYRWEKERRDWPSITPKTPPSKRTRPAGDHWCGAWCVTLLLLAAWPFVVVPWIVGGQVKVGAERTAVLAAREQAIRQAERDLGIGQ